MNQGTVPSLLAALIERLQGREALDLEFKAARSNLPSSLWSTVSAFANTQGGWIVLGVTEGDAGGQVEGVAGAQEQLQQFFNQLRNPNKISYPVCGVADAAIETIDDKDLIVIRVPATPRKMRPVYINHNPYTGTYIRRHAGDYPCTKPEVDRMMREASDAAADSSILALFTWNDLDRETFQRYRRRFQTHNPASPWIGYDDQRFLEAIGGYRADRQSGQRGITVAGLLMFGTPEALREWRTRHLIDYRLVFGGSNADQRWDDRVVWEGNLLGAFEVIYRRLTADLRVPFRLKGPTRVDQTPVHEALREALVNLLVHADYAETQASLIKHMPDGYLFRNPGSSRVLASALLMGDESDPRNPELLRMFRFIGLADEAGTGMPKIIAAWRELGFQLPAIDTGTERYEFALHLRHTHLLSEADRLWLRDLGSEWNEAEQLALVLARYEGTVDNVTLRGLTGQHPADTTKVLSGLRGRGFLQLISGGRGARYQLGPACNSNDQESTDHVGASLEGTPASPEDLLPSLEGTPASPEDLLPSLEGTPASPEDLLPSLEGIAAELANISRPAHERRRLTIQERDAIIVALCAQSPLGIREIAQLMNRSEPYIREASRALTASGRLTYLFPHQPSHPRQKYRAVGDPAQSDQGAYLP